MKNLIFIIVGVFFGIIMYKSEAASWFRIYEMFNFQSFHMYGIIGSAVVLGIVVVQIIKRTKLKDAFGQSIVLENKERGWVKGIVGGSIFGLGWALAGACPGPMFVLLGVSYSPIILVIAGALMGTWVYGLIKNKLPH